MDTYEKKLALAKEALDSGSYDKETIEYIFPELKESEDERIRKEIIKYFKKYQALSLGDYNVQDILSWLEKQGEHANFRNKIQIGDEVTRNEDGVLINLSRLKRVAKKDEKQGEQKDILEDAILDSNEDGLIAETIRYKNEKKPADKVEPKFKVKYAGSEYNVLDVKDIAGVIFYGIEDEPNHIDYVLPNNCEIVSEQKSSWSEEDEYCVHQLIVFCENCMVQDSGAKRCADWLKSLRSQSRWKPSDEQMDALRYVANFDYGGHKATLVSLYEQLKKLREK